MNLPFFVSRRYLFAKKSTNLVNLISGLSILILTLITSALVIVLSVFNGFDDMIKSFFSSFDPDFKISIAEGKVFSATDSLKSQIANLEEVAFFTEVLEENVVLEYNNKQDIARIKGVSDNFAQTSGIDSCIINGEYLLNSVDSFDVNGRYTYVKHSFAVMGYALAYRLSVNLATTKEINVLVPKRGVKPSLTNLNVLNKKAIVPIGFFSIMQDEYDSELLIVPIEFSRKLLEYYDEVSSIDIKLKPGADHEAFHQKLTNILGDKFAVKNRYQQHEFLYKMMESEKWAIYLILSFILIIASFNLTGSLTMLIIDKKDDIVTLQNMGACNSLIRKIFLMEGWFISILGALGGLAFGLVICWVQIEYGIVRFPDSYFVENYPVNIQLMDFVYVFLTVIGIGFIASWYPVRYITKKHLLL